MLTQLLSWPWIFYGALPVCAVALWPATRVPADRARGAARIDWPGIVTFSLAATGITFGFIRGGEAGWGDGSTLLGFGLGVVLLLAFALVERAATRPMVPLGLFRKPAFNGLLLASGAYYLGGFAFLPVLSLWLQNGAGLSAFATSLVITAQPVAFFATSALAGGALHRMPARWSVGGGTLLVAAGDLLLLLVVQPGANWPVLTPGWSSPAWAPGWSRRSCRRSPWPRRIRPTAAWPARPPTAPASSDWRWASPCWAPSSTAPYRGPGSAPHR
ncbi:membrane protein [Streptomyces noursei ATCC 11455]|uniref:hypothetical protein n=1 Tax=Streptomyces noursei TaxID=1971 RepID=UPI00081C4260|nr:membrane protein [Streptomyces noursei ATCC 11455]